MFALLRSSRRLAPRSFIARRSLACAPRVPCDTCASSLGDRAAGLCGEIAPLAAQVASSTAGDGSRVDALVRLASIVIPNGVVCTRCGVSPASTLRAVSKVANNKRDTTHPEAHLFMARYHLGEVRQEQDRPTAILVNDATGETTEVEVPPVGNPRDFVRTLVEEATQNEDGTFVESVEERVRRVNAAAAAKKRPSAMDPQGDILPGPEGHETALLHLQAAASASHPEATMRLAQVLLALDSPLEALKCLDRAADLGVTEAHRAAAAVAMGLSDPNSEGRLGVAERIAMGVRAGDPAAMLDLALIMLDPQENGMDPTDVKRIAGGEGAPGPKELIETADEAGVPNAVFFRALAHVTGELGTAVDIPAALNGMRRAAVLGSVDAQVWLAESLRTDDPEGIVDCAKKVASDAGLDPTTSIKDEILALYCAAAKNGHGEAGVNAASMLMETGDYEAAHDMYIEAAKAAQPFAFRALAEMYRKGIHVRPNVKLADYYDSQADELGAGES